jgi:hypothetical protein
LVTTINWSKYGTEIHDKDIIVSDTLFDVSGIVRAFIFIAALGISWPGIKKRNSLTRTPLSGLTTIENSRAIGSVFVNVPNQERPIMRAPAKVIVPIVEKV